MSRSLGPRRAVVVAAFEVLSRSSSRSHPFIPQQQRTIHQYSHSHNRFQLQHASGSPSPSATSLTSLSTSSSSVRSQQSKPLHAKIINNYNPHRTISISRNSKFQSLPPIFDVSQEISEALREGKPIVALESTIVSHGMPYPENYKTAIQVEEIVRKEGAVPATIAVLNGVVKVGLSSDELEVLARTGLKALKASRRDLALAVSTKATGATTVASTMAVAHAAGIEIFVTGGIGGVHRNGETTMDISADLTELGRTPVTVVCAGVKSILDIGRTLEYLETQGVPVVSFGTDEFPAFYVPKSGFKSIAKMNNTDECAALIAANSNLGLQNGVLIGVPIPKEMVTVDADAMDKVISEALKMADKEGISGKEITPYLLDKVKTITGGKSLEANIALIKNNAKVGAQIACSLSRLRNGVDGIAGGAEILKLKSTSNPPSSRTPLIIGGTVLDVTAKPSPRPSSSSSKYMNGGNGTNNNNNKSNQQSSSSSSSSSSSVIIGTSVPGEVKQSLGGVGRNLAEACFRVGGKPRFISFVGDDLYGRFAVGAMKDMGMDTSEIQILPQYRTAVYNAILRDDGELMAAIADMEVHQVVSSLGEKVIMRNGPSVIAFDGNISVRVIEEVVNCASRNGIPCLFEPTSVPKSLAVFRALKCYGGGLSVEALSRAVRLITPNHDEVVEMSLEAKRLGIGRASVDYELGLGETVKIFESAWTLSSLFETQLIKLGPDGVLLVTPRDSYWRQIQDAEVTVVQDKAFVHWRPKRVLHTYVSATGAGDTMVGTILAKLGPQMQPLQSQSQSQTQVQAQQQGNCVLPARYLHHAIKVGMATAERTLMSERAVCPDLDQFVGA
ncbi:hypothetical protein HDU76_001745 [Blyttiomyces sp. JEL0837]|nr:hypothetical protein HDU76_001745 [Blyttiomyces sp. JEL0837]